MSYDVGYKYSRLYLTLKSQYTLLSSLEESLNHNFEHDDSEKNAILSLVGTLKRSTIGHLLDSAYTVIDTLYSNSKKDSTTAKIERYYSVILKASFSIHHISTFLDAYTNEDKEIQDEINESKINTSYECQHENFVVCRICDEKIQIDKIDEHSAYCLKAYKSEERKQSIIKEINTYLQSIYNEKLNVPWPNKEDDMINLYFPILQAALILQRSMEIDSSLTDAIKGLLNLSQVLIKINARQEPKKIIIDCIKLIHDLKCVQNALKAASTGLIETRISKNPNPISIRAVNISDFDFIKRISSGAFASVFVAKKHKTGDIYAIKAIPLSLLNEKNQTKRVLSEKDILLSFSNPYIVSFYYSIIGKRNLYLVTEFIQGGDLYSLLQKMGSFDEMSSKYYIVQIVRALKYLRENAIIHRDIKPDNILVTDKGSLKLTDFGLSRQGAVNRQIANDSDDINSEPEIVGTLDYMAPEIFLNKCHTYAVDYWSLGAMLYEFLTGVPPFHSEKEKDTISKILRSKVVFLPEDEISSEAQDLIQKLLQPDPKLRLGYNDINEILNHPWLKGINPDLMPPPFVPELKSSVDTTFFEQRYQFSRNSDNDILLDIKESQSSSKPQSIRKDIQNFPSLSIDNLARANKKAVSKFQPK